MTKKKPITQSDIEAMKAEKAEKELLPCPFCGGEAKLHAVFDMETGDTIGWFAWCSMDNHCVVRPETEDYFTEAEAAEAWNTRAERTCFATAHGYLNGSPMRCWSCSICNYGWHVSDNDKPYSYCPNCGAKVVSE